MIDFSELAISPNESRAARNFLGLSQSQAAEQSSLQAHKLKRFETGNYMPDEQFVQDLREFYEGQGYNFGDEDAPGAKAKARGDVFPAGVVGKTTGSPMKTDGFSTENRVRPMSANLQFMRIHPSLEGDQIDRILDRIEDNESEVISQSATPVTTGFLSDSPSVLSQAQAIGVLRRLAENGLLHAKLLGREVLTKSDATTEDGEDKPSRILFASTGSSTDTIGDLLTAALGDVALAVDGDKDAQARLKGRAEPTEVLQALIG